MGVFSTTVSFLLEDIMMNTFGHNLGRKTNIVSNFFTLFTWPEKFCHFSEAGKGQTIKVVTKP